jgi:hypothetical protein
MVRANRYALKRQGRLVLGYALPSPKQAWPGFLKQQCGKVWQKSTQ